MRLVILGTGAIGGVIAGFLQRAGREVLALARGAQLAAIREQGLEVETPDEVFVARCAVAESRGFSEWRDGDVLVVAVKTQDLAGALRELAPPPHVPIACMTNGVEAERIALRHARDVYGAVVMMPATYLTPGTVQVWASPVPGLIDLGRYPDGTGDHADAIAGELTAAGFDVAVRPSIMRWKRAKLISNLANGAEALAGPAARASDVGAAARAEARACFAAANLACATDAEMTARRGDYASRPIANATRSGGSAWQSLARGGALETDYLNGEIALLGRLHGVPTPVNEALQSLAAEGSAAGLAPGAWSIDELASRVAARIAKR